MARKPRKVRKPKNGINESGLMKGQLRKLNALRKSLGDDIANKAFAEWYNRFGTDVPDKNAKLIGEVLEGLAQEHNMTFPRGGYLVKRGRGRIIVTPAAD